MSCSAIISFFCRSRSRASEGVRLGLEYPVHLLVPAVLTRPARGNQIDADAMPQPPNVDHTQPPQPGASKRCSVVLADALGQAVFAEQPPSLPVCAPAHSPIHAQRGANVVELALLVALVALIAIPSAGVLGETVSNRFDTFEQ